MLNADRRRLLLAAAALPWARPAVAGSDLPPLAPLRMHTRTLGNGLQVITLPEARAATVAVEVWYRVGSKDDPPGRSGFAHLFEHMMFKRTRYLANEAFDRLTEDVGGVNNAFTSDDVTVYQNLVPANHLERLLWAEAERMSNLEVDQASFDSERAVVAEEYRERVLADPYGRLINALPGLAFTHHPYRRPTIGNLDELNAATLDDVRRFHATYYRPDNAILIVAGGFDADSSDALVDRHFAGLPRPQTDIPRVSVREPRRKAGRRVTLHGPTVPLPALALLWQGPPLAHDDAPALQVAGALLSRGESSRLHEALVYRARSAQTAGFYVELGLDAGMLTAYAVAAGGGALAPLEAALREQIAALATGRIGAAELDKVRTQLLTAAIAERETPAGRAQAVAWAVLTYGDARAADRQIARLQAVSAADVQAVLRRYVVNAPAVAVHYSQARQPKRKSESSAGGRS